MGLTLQCVSTMGDAQAALQSADSRYLGGGTLLLRAANEGDLSFSTLVRIENPSLANIEVRDGEVIIGAGVTMAQIAAEPELQAIAPAARAVGGPAVRNMATVGGNLFAPSPYGDFAVALLALDAEIGVNGAETPVETFLAGRDERSKIVSRIRFRLPGQEEFRFLKVTRVKPRGLAVLTLAAVIELEGKGKITGARIALGAMADRPIRAYQAERALVGKALSKDGISASLAVIGEETAAITDSVASAWYRNEVLPVHYRRLLLGN